MNDITLPPQESTSLIVNETNNLNHHSRFLRKIAWVVEIIVVFIGLCISISLVSTGTDIASSFTLSAPFIMISLVELTKIPFVIGLWHSRKSFLMYLIIICLLSLITFETLLNGFERAFSSINSQINLSEIEISRIDNQIKINDENIQIALKNYGSTVEKIASDKDNAQKNYRRQYNNALKRSESLSKNVPQLRALLRSARDQLIHLKEQKSALLQEFSSKKEARLQSSMNRSQNNVNAIVLERTRLLDKIKLLNQEKIKALEEAGFFTTSTVKKEYETKILYAEKQLAALNDKTITGENNKLNLESVKFLDNYYADLLSLKDDIIKQKENEVELLEHRYNLAVSASSKNLARQQRQFSKERNFVLNKLENKLEKVHNDFSTEADYIKKLKQVNTQLRYDIRVIEIKVNTLALSNQVYRMASYVDNVSNYKEIKHGTLTLVGLIWFGSLALIGAITGIALTLSGLHLSNLAAKRHKKHNHKKVDV